MTTKIVTDVLSKAIALAAPRLFGGQTKFIALHDALLSESQNVDEHFRILREADMNTAVNAYLRGIKVRRQSKHIVNGVWRIDLEFALERAQDGYSRVSLPEQKIKCYEIMCICFLALRKPNEAFASILHSTETLLKNEYVNSSLSSLKKTIQRPRKSLSTADSVLLSLLFNRVCGTIQACSQDKDWTCKNREEFRILFRGHKDLTQATDPELFQEWERLQVTTSSGWISRSSRRSNDIIRLRAILVDLTQSDAACVYRLGDISVVENGDQHKVVPATRSSRRCLVSEATSIKAKVTTIKVTAPLLFMAFILLVVLTTTTTTMNRMYSSSPATPFGLKSAALLVKYKIIHCLLRIKDLDFWALLLELESAALLMEDRIVHFLPQIEDLDFWALE